VLSICDRDGHAGYFRNKGAEENVEIINFSFNY